MSVTAAISFMEHGLCKKEGNKAGYFWSHSRSVSQRQSTQPALGGARDVQGKQGVTVQQRRAQHRQGRHPRGAADGGAPRLKERLLRGR